MSTSKGSIFDRLRSKREPEAPAVEITAPASALPAREVENDAGSYGVQIQPANVSPGTTYWQAVRVHHLTPSENAGNHHIYMDVCDGVGGDERNGARVNGARLRVRWEGGEQIVTIDKPANEPGANFPMWKWQVCSVECLGLPGQELPSDRVVGMHTGHPDEAPGNTLFHHSFGVTFVRTVAAEQVYTDSVIYGVVHNASGRNVLLMKGGEEIVRKLLGLDETFRFTGLPAGEYVVAVEDTDLKSAPTHVSGRDQIMLDLTLVLRQSMISGKLRNGAGRTVALVKGSTELATQVVAVDETFRFTGLPAGSYRVTLPGTHIASETLTVNGANSVTANLLAPTPGKAIEHYVLFGPAGAPRTQANLLLALDYILAFGATFGFNPTEAQAASRVTIIGGPEDVGLEVERLIGAGGGTVQRVAGTAEEIAAALSARMAKGSAF